MMMAALEKVLLVVVIVFCAVLAVQSMGIRAPARTFPLVVTGLTGAMAAYALARSAFRPMTVPIFGQGRGHYLLAGVAGLVGYVLAMSVSYLAATLVFLFAGYLYLMPERSMRGVAVAACVALAATAFTWLCFSYWLGVNLP